MNFASLLPHFAPRIRTNALKDLIAEAAKAALHIKIANLTGGPCAGKTESLIVLEREFTKRDYQVIVLPEAATIIRNAGFRSEQGFFSSPYCQRMMITLNEDNLMNAVIACMVSHVPGTEKKVLIIRDRCSIDGAAYMPSLPAFESLLVDMGLSLGDLECADVTIFLRSLGFDNPELYDICSANNTARFENAAQAKAADERLLEVYQQYSHPHVIDNSTDFETKLRRVVDTIVDALGEPKLEKELAFMVRTGIDQLFEQLGLDRKDPVRLTQFYMEDGDRYREILYPGGIHRKFVRTYKEHTDDPLVRIEREVHVSASEFVEAKSNRDKKLAVITKDRYANVVQIGDSYYVIEIDHFTAGIPADLVRVEIEYGLHKPRINRLLGSLDHVDVSGRKDCSNSSIAAGKFPWDLFPN